MTDDRAKHVLKKVKERANGTPVMVAKLSRISGATYLFVEVADEIEDLFKTENVRESSTWTDGDQPHSFYNSSYAGDLRRLMRREHDSYGGDYITEEGNINKAIFRTVGLSDGKTFKIDGPYSDTALTNAVPQLREFAEEVYQKFLSPTVLVSEVKQLDIDALTSTGGR